MSDELMSVVTLAAKYRLEYEGVKPNYGGRAITLRAPPDALRPEDHFAVVFGHIDDPRRRNTAAMRYLRLGDLVPSYRSHRYDYQTEQGNLVHLLKRSIDIGARYLRFQCTLCCDKYAGGSSLAEPKIALVRADADAPVAFCGRRLRGASSRSEAQCPRCGGCTVPLCMWRCNGDCGDVSVCDTAAAYVQSAMERNEGQHISDCVDAYLQEVKGAYAVTGELHKFDEEFRWLQRLQKPALRKLGSELMKLHDMRPAAGSDLDDCFVDVRLAVLDAVDALA